MSQSDRIGYNNESISLMGGKSSPGTLNYRLSSHILVLFVTSAS